MGSSKPPISLRLWSYDDLREPQVTALPTEVRAIRMSLNWQAEVPTDSSQLVGQTLRHREFARVVQNLLLRSQLGSAASRVPHGTRVG